MDSITSTLYKHVLSLLVIFELHNEREAQEPSPPIPLLLSLFFKLNDSLSHQLWFLTNTIYI